MAQQLNKMGAKISELPDGMEITGGSKTPPISPLELQNLGFKIVFFPLTALMAVTEVMSACFRHLQEQGTTDNLSGLMNFQAFQNLMGVPEYLAVEKEYKE
jgi:methylisocitrate lyase